MYTAILTTGDRFEKDLKEGGIIIANKGDLKMWQKVLAVGDSVRGINPGDTVMLNMQNYAVRKYDPNSLKKDLGMDKIISYNFNWVTMDDENGNNKERMLFQDRDVMYIFEGEETEENEKSSLITPPSTPFTPFKA